MKHPTQSLQDTLQRINTVLEQDAFFSLTTAELGLLKEKIAAISGKLVSIQGTSLTVGLLGGTGVGKSTLMNALAGAEIASAGHRRPHTDQALIYRHADATYPPDLPSTNLPLKEIVHHVEEIKQVLLCDLPDFDSLLEKHREYVLGFLEYLDVVIWVVSPEKYADGRFYQFLQMAPKSGRNYYFVLNKADLLFEGEAPATGHERLANVINRFQEHLEENGVQNPLIYALAALPDANAAQGRPWNQLNAFRHTVFQHRDIKQITNIKASNLEAEVRNVLTVIHKEAMSLEAVRKILKNAIQEFHARRPQWHEAGQRAFDLWLKTYPIQTVLTRYFDPSRLVGPGYAIALLFEKWGHTPEAQAPSLDGSEFTLSKEAEIHLQRHLEWLENRINHQILVQNLSPAFGDRFQEALNGSNAMEDLNDRFAQVFAARTSVQPMRFLLGFKSRQFFVYLLVFILFGLGIGGETAWQDILSDPGVNHVLRLLLSCVLTLFSTKGLAALLSYFLINLFFGVRFYRKYQNLLRRAAQKVTQSIKAELETVWAEKHKTILEDLQHFEKDLQQQTLSISSLINGDDSQEEYKG